MGAGAPYLGQWQIDFWKVIYTVAFGVAIGAPITYVYQYTFGTIIILFFTLVWANRCSLWDRFGKVIVALGIVLGKVLT